MTARPFIWLPEELWDSKFSFWWGLKACPHCTTDPDLTRNRVRTAPLIRIEPVQPKPLWEVVSNRFGLITHAHDINFKGNALAKKSLFNIFLFFIFTVMRLIK